MFKHLNIKHLIFILFIMIFTHPRTSQFLGISIQDTLINLSLSYTYTSSTPITLGPTPVVFIFDSSLEVIEPKIFEQFESYGCSGTIGIIPSRVSESDHLSYKEIGILAKKNWDFVNQSYSYPLDTYDTPEKLLEDFNTAKTWMNARSLGASSEHLILPDGEVNPYLLPLLQQEGYSSVKTYSNIILLKTQKPTYFDVKCIDLSLGLSSQEIISYLDSLTNEAPPIVFTYIPNYPLSELEYILEFLSEHRDYFQVVTYTQLIGSSHLF